MATVAVLGAGTLTGMEATAGAITAQNQTGLDAYNAWVSLSNTILKIPAVGAKGEFVETTPLSSQTKTYIAGIDEGEEAELEFNYIDEDAGLIAALAAATGRQARWFKFTYENDVVVYQKFALSGFSIPSPEQGSQLKVMIMGKASGAPIFGA